MAAGQPLIPSLSAKEALILQLLGRSREMYGLELVAASDGGLKRGTVYVTLARMQQKGYLASRVEAANPGAIGLPRRLYQPTALGLRVMHAWALAARAFAGQLPQEV